MVAAEHAAKMLGLNQRRIFQIIETGMVHFSETDTGTTFICIASMTEGDETQSVSVERSEDGRDPRKEIVGDIE